MSTVNSSVPTLSPAMTRILDLFDRDPNRRIEEVIKVDQTNVQVVRQEIEEYHPTDSIKDSYRKILDRFQETPHKPHEGIGVWISGFFGAGKSSFAKILGYALEDRALDGTSAAELFARQTSDPTIQALLKTVNHQIPAKAVIFDVSTDQAVTNAEEKLTDIVYRILLRELGYAPDREIAELEIELEEQGRLEAFQEAVERVAGQPWNEIKAYAATARNRASRALHEMDPDTYPAADTWARTPKKVEVSANFVAKRAHELMQRRGDGRALVFIIDEVGQYVARSTDKMLDLQGLVQALGREGRNHASEWKGQVWLVATSQERLSEVVDNLEGKTVELARLRDRFAIEVDLAPSDIREVTSQRVLKKTPSAKAMLQGLYEENKGKLTQATQLTGTLQGPPLNAGSFAELYPFLPYQIDLVIGIVSGLRTQAGASRHVGGANRTIIKLAQQVLINDRTALGESAVGRLVTLDALYDLLEGLVSSERRRDVEEIGAAYGHDGVETRVAKALALLQFVPPVPRTPENLAAVLHPRVDAAPEREAVAAALQELAGVSKARETEGGWELLSHVGKSWEEERRGIEVFPKDRAALLTGAAEMLFSEVGGYRHQNLRTFTITPFANEQRLGSKQGDIDLRVRFVTDPEALPALRDQARQTSNTDQGQNALHWVVPISDELAGMLTDLHRSGVMISRHERDHTPEQAKLLTDEKSRQSSLRGRLSGMLKRTFREGDQFFRGVHTPLKEFGAELEDVVRGALRTAVPKLYPKFDLAAVQVRSAGDAARILENDALGGLPAVYYEGKDGLGVVQRRGGGYEVDTHRPALQEVLGYIKQRRDFGEKPTGKQLEAHFTGFGYGWELEAVMLLAATLLRASEVEVYSGRRFTSYADAAVREVFRKTQPFRSATFSPREGGLTFDQKARIAQVLEEWYGEQVFPEEGALAKTLRRRLPAEADRAVKVLSVLRAEHLPGADAMQDLVDTLRGILDEDAAEDALLAFHGQLDSIRSGLQRVKKLENALAESNLGRLHRARTAADRLWPQLEDVGFAATPEGEELAGTVAALREQLTTPEFFDHLPQIAQREDAVRSAYQGQRSTLAERIRERVQHLTDELRNREIWTAVPELEQQELLRPFERIREKAEGDTASLSEMSSDLLALDGLHARAGTRLIEIFEKLQAPEPEEGGEPAPRPVVKRIRASSYAGRGLRTEQEVLEALEGLRTACLEAVAKGETVILE